MKRLKLVSAVACSSLLSVNVVLAQPSQFGVQFRGQQSDRQNPCPALQFSDVTGVVPQANWNPVDNHFADPSSPDVGTVGPLWDSNLVFSANVMLSFAADDAWFNDVPPGSITNPAAILMNGFIKSSAGASGPAVFTFHNVPEGQYDLYVYGDMNGDNSIARIWDSDNLSTLYLREQHQFTDASGFLQSTATSAVAAAQVANYVKFSNLGTYGRGQIGVSAQWVSGNDGIGICGLQLVPAGAAQPNTNSLGFLVQPVNRRGALGYSNVTFTTTVRGPSFSVQWFKNGALVATGTSYTPAPITAGDNGARITVVASNNVNSITSSNAILTVGQFITNNGLVSMDGGTISILSQPQNTQVVAGQGPVSFSVLASSGYLGDSSAAAPPIAYQWQSSTNGASSFADIAGATNAGYTIPLPLISYNATQFRVVVTAGGTNVTSNPAVLTVLPDTQPPTALSAAAFPGSTQVGVSFSEALDPTTATAAANYQINGAAILAAILRTNVANELTSEQNLVSLICASSIADSFTVSISGMQDVSGNPIASTNLTGQVLGLTISDIGSSADAIGGPDPLVPTIVTNWGQGNFDVLCNGNDFWNNADGFNFIWEPKTNSFDVRVRVVSVLGVDSESAGAIEVREGPPTSTGGGWELARHYSCKVDYAGSGPSLDNSGPGANLYQFNGRRAQGNPAIRELDNTQGINNGATNTAGSSYSWGGVGPGNVGSVPFPNAWIRVARVKSVSNNVTNDHLLGYSSIDGSNWNLRQDVDLMDVNHAGWLNTQGKPAGPLPDLLYVGLGSTSHTGIGNGNATNSIAEFAPPNDVLDTPWLCWVIYRDFGDTPPATIVTGATVAIACNADGTVTLTYTGNLYSSPTASGSFLKVPGASNPFTINPKTSGNTTTFYRAGP